MKLSKNEKGLEKSKTFQKKILYIEDNEDTAEAVKIILTKVGFKTHIALSGKDGLRKAKNHFDLILLDIMLPDMSGWDIFRALSKKVKGSKYVILSVIPVSTERMAELKKAGISDYITKPFKKEDLIARIKKVLKWLHSLVYAIVVYLLKQSVKNSIDLITNL